MAAPKENGSPPGPILPTSRIAAPAPGQRRQKGVRTLDIVFLLHDRLSTTVMLYMAALGLWGLVAWFRGQALSGSLGGALVIAEILVLVQVGAGLLLVAASLRPPTATHYLYGITAVLALPFAWSWLRGRDQRQALLIYSLLALFIFGLAVRGAMTGR
jgi:hypothetical protein